MGHGKQQLMVPLSVGTGAQSRPRITGMSSVVTQDIDTHTHTSTSAGEA